MSENSKWENMAEPGTSIVLDLDSIALQEHSFSNRCECKVYADFESVEFLEHIGGRLDIILTPRHGNTDIKTRLIINRDVAKKIIEKILE